MLFFKLIFLAILTLFPPPYVKSYVYPIWRNYDKQEKLTEHSGGDESVTAFMITNFFLPMRESFCNICSNFLEVYECILANAEYIGEQSQPKARTLIEKILEYIGLYNNHEFTSPPSCSYYSILVVTMSTMLFIGLVFVTKKLVDYVKEEEDRIFPQVLYDYDNKCPCYKKD